MADTQEQEVIDWDEAPEWANWVAKDENGRVYWYANKPVATVGEWCVVLPGIGELAGKSVTIPGPWRGSLRQRPAQKAGTATAAAAEYHDTVNHQTKTEKLKQAAKQFQDALNAIDFPVDAEVHQIDCVNMGGDSKRIYSILIKHVGQIFP